MNKINHTINLFEFGDWEKYLGKQTDFIEFEAFLNTIWNNKQHSTLGYGGTEKLTIDEEEAKEQGFLKFNHLQQTIRGRNYVGVIRYGDTVVNLLPKIFKTTKSLEDSEIKTIHAHILWWLSYCGKITFPKSWSSFNQIQSNFFEVLIYLFANYTKTTLSKIIYQTYREIQSELPYMKGRIDMPNYIKNNLSNGRWHRLSCTFDSFELDNHFNQIIKYVAKLLRTVTTSAENKKLLNDIIFLLDEVSDKRVTIHDCQKVNINPLFKELYPILDYCKLFLSNSTIFKHNNQLEVFAFLLPMEMVFEDFIYGFMKKHLKAHYKSIQSQKSDKYLATLFYGDKKGKENVFQLRHDIFIKKNDSSNLILDTKYKLIYTNAQQKDKKHGVSQSDMYQMVSYAIRRKCNQIKLVYPNHLNSTKAADIRFQIKDEFSSDMINIEVVELPVCDTSIQIQKSDKLQRVFEKLELKLQIAMQKMLQ